MMSNLYSGEDDYGHLCGLQPTDEYFAVAFGYETRFRYAWYVRLVQELHTTHNLPSHPDSSLYKGLIVARAI